MHCSMKPRLCSSKAYEDDPGAFLLTVPYEPVDIDALIWPLLHPMPATNANKTDSIQNFMR